MTCEGLVEFSLCCPCGETLIVGTIDAGRTRLCSCGVNYKVPSMSEMRKLDADGAVFVTPVRVAHVSPQEDYKFYTEAEKLEELVRRGKLPLEQECIFCGYPDKDVLNVEIECERSKEQRAHPLMLYFAISLFDPLDAFRKYVEDSEEKEIVGKDVIVKAPLRICASCAPPLFAKPAAVREKMRLMPLYQPLLDEYPQATIRILE